MVCTLPITTWFTFKYLFIIGVQHDVILSFVSLIIFHRNPKKYVRSFNRPAVSLKIKMEIEGKVFCSNSLLPFLLIQRTFNDTFGFVETVTFFERCMEKEPGMSAAVAAIHTLIEFISNTSGRFIIRLCNLLVF